MLKFIHKVHDRTVKVKVNDCTHIDDAVEAFVNFLRAIGYRENTIAGALTSEARILERYLDAGDGKEDV